jgi:hypothetical protein
MPIQFRCVHCRQLLGISNARAGTQVDCPACGRSLKVPAENGGSALPVSTSSPKVDAGLLGALSELASLTGAGPNGAFDTRAASPARAKSAPEPQPVPVSRKRDSLRIVPIKTQTGKTPFNTATNAPEGSLFESPERVFEQLANLPPVPLDDAPLILTDVEPDGDDPPPESLSVSHPTQERTRAASGDRREPKNRRDGSGMAPELTDAFAELAGSAPSPNNPSSTGGNREKRTLNEGSSGRSSGLGTIATIAMLIVAFAGGLLAERYLLKDQALADAADLAKKTDASGDATEQVVLKQAITPASGDAQAIETISGRVTYTGSDGGEKPDSSALALLLPVNNSSNLKLDATPLRDLQQTPARMAIETALSVLGATVVRADEDGQFKLPRKSTDPATLVIISRHAARPEGQSVPAEIQAALSMWLTSPAQLLGRLAVQTQPLSAVAKDSLVPPVKILFAPGK